MVLLVTLAVFVTLVILMTFVTSVFVKLGSFGEHGILFEYSDWNCYTVRSALSPFVNPHCYVSKKR